MPVAAGTPRVVVGTAGTVIYDFVSAKPVHRSVTWAEGIWSASAAQFQACRERRCLLLLAIDPATKHHIYQHGGDGGPVLEIEPNQAGYTELRSWLESVHATEDLQVSAVHKEGTAPKPTEPRHFQRFLSLLHAHRT